jgi:TPR repeat protein
MTPPARGLLLGTAVELLSGVVGYFISLVSADGKFHGEWLLFSLPIALVAAYLGTVADRTPPKELDLSIHRYGQPKLFKEVRDSVHLHTGLNIHKSRYDTGGQLIKYVSRGNDKEEEGIVDTRIRDKITDNLPIVIVRGAHLAGSTRSLYEAAMKVDELKNRRLLTYYDTTDDTCSLEEILQACQKWVKKPFLRKPRLFLLWLEHLTERQINELNPAFIDKLPENLRILATANDPVGVERAESAKHILEKYSVKLEATLNPYEQHRFREIHPRLKYALEDETNKIVGELVGTLDVLKEAITLREASGSDKGFSFPDLVLVRLVTDWQRMNMPVGLERQTIEEIYPEYYKDIYRAYYDSDPKYMPSDQPKRALKKLNNNLIFVRRELSSKKDVYKPALLLLDVANENQEHSVHAWSVQESLLQYARNKLSKADRLSLGLNLYKSGDFAHAARFLKDFAATKIGTGLCCQLGTELRDLGLLDEAKVILQKVADTKTHTSVHAKNTLGAINNTEGNYKDAIKNLRAAAAKDPTYTNCPIPAAATYNLALIYYVPTSPIRDPREAIKLFKKVARTGRPIAKAKSMYKLGVLMDEIKNSTQSTYWYKRADEAFNDLLIDAAATNDDPEYLCDLFESALYVKEYFKKYAQCKELAEAVLKLAPKVSGAFRRETTQIVNFKLGFMHNRAPFYDPEKAKRFYEDAIRIDYDQDITYKAMFNLGELVYRTASNLVEAERLFTKAIKSKDSNVVSGAYYFLGRIAEDRGKIGDLDGFKKAVHLYTKSIDTKPSISTPLAMVSLARIGLAFPESQEESIRLLKEAISMGHKGATKEARKLLKGRETQLQHEHYDAQRLKASQLKAAT